jgi:PKD repeat protein
MIVGLPLLFACGGDNLTLPSEGQPAHIAIKEGTNGQQGPVNSTLAESLTVIVTDTQNRPVQGTTVEFVLIEDGEGGTVSPATAVTNAAGEASASITLGTQVGTLRGVAQVRVDQGTPQVTTSFTATATATGADSIAAYSGDGQSAPAGTPLPQPLVVQVTDGFGNPISGVTVQWSAEGAGSISAPSSVTDGSGLASVQRILGPTAGQQTTLASVEGLKGSPVTFTHTATAGTAARVVIVSGNNQQAAPGSRLADPVVVQVLDGQNNPIVGTPVTWVIGVGEGAVEPQTNVTDDQGRSSTQWTLGPAPGRNTLSAVVSGVGVAEFTATATKASSSTEITSHQPEPSAVGQVVEVRVQVAGPGATPSGTVSVTAESVSTCTITLSGGSGACSLIFGAAGNFRITATYAGDSRFNGSSDNENHRVEAPNSAPTAAFTPPTCTAGQSCQFNDNSSDSDGNVVAWTWNFGDGGTSDQKDPSHVYAAPGTYDVKLTVGDNDGATAEVTQQVTVSSAPPTNGAPVANPDNYATPAGVPLEVNAPGVLLNDTDPESSPLTAQLVTGPQGIVVLNSDGSFTYFPGLAGSGSTDTFTYSASDGSLSSTATVTITIQ